MANTTASARGTKRKRDDAGEKEHGQEDDADAQRRDQGGNGDLRGSFQDRVVYLVSIFEIALDVLDGDGGIVDQDTDGEGQTAQGHDVDGLAQETERKGSMSGWKGEWRSAMISVLRQLPRKSRIIRPVSTAAMIASRMTRLRHSPQTEIDPAGASFSIAGERSTQCAAAACALL